MSKATNYTELPGFERKQFPSFVKQYDDDLGIVEHIVAVIGNIDEGSDRITTGAFSKTISERGLRVKCLDQHNTDSVTSIVGKPIEMREIGLAELPREVIDQAPDAIGGLYVKTQYAIDTQKGRDVFNLVKGGYAPETSIGYDPVVVEYVTEKDQATGKEKTIRELREIRLWEYSNVVFGMNPATTTMSAKAKPDEGKPYRAFREGDQWVVYKIDEEGQPVGDALGSHDSEEEAADQIRALYAAEEDDDEEMGKEAARTETDGEQPAQKDEKAGRVLAARNAKRIMDAMRLLHEALSDAGLMDRPDDEDSKSAPERAALDTEHKAGPGESLPTSEMDDISALLREIEFEQTYLDIMEV